MPTYHKLIFGNSRDMREVLNESIHLVITSPPYFNAPFDYPDLFESYDAYLDLMRKASQEIYRVLAPGRIVCIVCDDVLIESKKYPVVADLTKIFIEAGFSYRDRILWVKPEGYIRISRRSGVILQHPYPMYFYPDNIQESILLFQKGKFDYETIPEGKKELSALDIGEYQKKKWYLNVWQITNVLPLPSRIERGIAAFPEEIVRRLILLFSYKDETVLDPFMGSGTTNKVARILGRNSIGYEIDLELLPIIKRKVRIDEPILGEEAFFEIIIREDAKHLRTWLQEKVKGRRSVAGGKGKTKRT